MNQVNQMNAPQTPPRNSETLECPGAPVRYIPLNFSFRRAVPFVPFPFDLIEEVAGDLPDGNVPLENAEDNANNNGANNHVPPQQ
jgi:hypothetical protein